MRAAKFAVAGLLMLAAFTAVSSLVFCWGTGLLGRLDLPWLQWWLWLGYDGENAAVAARWLKIGGIVGLVPVGGLVLLEVKELVNPTNGGSQHQPKRGKSDNHGHADWMTMAAARRLFPGPDDRHGGVVVGEAYRVDEDRAARVPFDPRSPRTWGQGGKAPLLIDPCTSGSGHSIVIAGSGAFKSTSLVSTMLRWTGGAVVLDPSCELGPMLTRARQDLGHQVFSLSPATAFEVGTNVLDWIDIASPLAATHVRSVVGWICGEGNDDRAATPDGHFFRSRGRSLIACLLADLLWDDSVGWETKTLRTLRQGLVTPEHEMRKLLRSIHRTSRSQMARDLAGAMMDMVDETFSGVYANADEDTAWLSNPAYAALVSGDSFRCADLVNGRMDVFLQVPLQSLMHTPAIARVLLGALMNAAYEADGSGHRVLFALDEVFHLGRMKLLEQARDTGRKHGITLQLLYQSTGQIERQWGREGRRAWFDSVSWRAYAAVSDLETARELQDTIGTYGVLATSEGTTAGNSGGGLFMSQSSAGRSENLHEIKRPLIMAQELREARTDELFVLARGVRPLRCGRAIYFRRPEMTRLVDENRFHGEAAA